MLKNPQAVKILVEEWDSAHERRHWHIGRYVIMPDHVHFFCAPGEEAKDLSQFMKSWKEWTSERIKKYCNIQDYIWQAEFFVHSLRNEERYVQKWNYVLYNPVCAGFVKDPNEWPWQGAIEIL